MSKATLPANLRNLPTINIFLLHTLGLVAAYSLFVGGNWFHFRYTTTVGLLSSALLIGLFYRYVSAKRMRTAYLLIISTGLLALHILFSPRLSLALQRDNLYETVVWLNQNIPDTSKVGAFQSGIIGYYADFPVVNLDGKVNSAAYAALTSGTMWQYLCRTEIDYIADWPSLIELLLINRSTDWNNDNIIVVQQLSRIKIYAVNRAHCLPP